MDKNWEIKKVSTCERVAQKITERMERPVVILNLGLPGPVAADATMRLRDNIHVPMASGSMISAHSDVKSFAQWLAGYPVSMFSLPMPERFDREFRRKCVKAFREAGAKTVVGFIAEPLADDWTRLPMLKDVAESPWWSVPTVDEFDYLITALKE